MYQIPWMIYHQVILSRIKCSNVEITHGQKLPSSRLTLLKLNCCKEKSFTQIFTNWSYSKLAKIVLPNKKQSELDKSYFSCIAQISLHLPFHFLNVTSMYHFKIFARLYYFCLLVNTTFSLVEIKAFTFRKFEIS